MTRVIIDVLKWYLVLSGIGVLGFPIVFAFLRKLPGRGFVFSRSLGMILITFVFWLGGTLGFLRNDIGGLLFAVLCIAALSLTSWIRRRTEIREWLTASRKYCAVSELVFLLAFLLIIFFRLGGPEVSGTEKPMEMMFINSILKSETFPPQDAWLSGYSISYYYFGYIMSAALVMLTGVASSAGFNLMLASVFAMAAVSAFGIVNDLLDLRKKADTPAPELKFRSLFAPLFVLIAGNLEGLFEVLHSLHLFWSPDGTSGFWTWLGLKELTEFPSRAASWNPTGRSGIWWWRASRVVGDTGLLGSAKEVIDEFPMFSFELGDLHPHVIAIPFVLFSIAIALNALMLSLSRSERGPFFAEGLAAGVPLKETEMGRWICSAEFWLAAVCVGALLFLNMWDFPFYFGLYCLCVTAAYLRRNGWNRQGFAVFFETAFPFGAACLMLYLLFFMSFSSQAGGIAPSGVFVTRPVHFLIMFGFFLVPIFVWQFSGLKQCGGKARRFGIRAALVISLILMILECAVVFLLLAVRAGNTGGTLGMAADAFTGMQEITTMNSGLAGFFARRLNALPTLIILFAAAGLAFARIRHFDPAEASADPEEPRPSDVFCSLMILIGAALVIFPEFFYLRDLFGTRMNTIFKFYYQAWILFALSAAYALAVLPERVHGVRRVVFAAVMVLLTSAVMIYPVFCAAGKWDSLRWKNNLTLDGADYLKSSRSSDWDAMQWLAEAEPGIVLEKVGSSYGGDNIVSTFTGLPAVLGPMGHESQWRGGYQEIGSRNDDIRKIYETHSWDTAAELLETYGVRYVFAGSAEKSAYNIQENKFDRNLTLVYDSGNCKIWQVY